MDILMKLSIITINYNNHNGLKKTIDSMISQSYKDYEWIVIDGGSTDGSKELIEQYSQYMFYHVSEPDKGIYNAMNKGILVSHGEYLLFLNSGDYLFDKNVLERVAPLLKNKDIYVGRINSIGMDNVYEEKQSDFSPEGILRKLSFSWIPHQASFFKRTVFSEYGLYRDDMKIISDWWLYFRSLVIGNASAESISFVIANYDTSGISATQKSVPSKEYRIIMQDYPCINTLFQFYGQNLEIVEALRGNRTFFFLFRVYFYIYRKLFKK